MSLFRVKSLWATHVGDAEEFASGGLCVDRFNGDEVLIVVGSLNGILRIFRPCIRAYRLEDQLCVIDLRFPILQIEAGCFTTGAQKSCAVLHPTSVRLLSFDVVPDAVTHQEIYCLSLPRSVANMVCEYNVNRGGSASIRVQSLDGELYRIHNATLEISGSWSEHLIAGPLAYVPQKNALVTSRTTFALICYARSPLKAAISSLNISITQVPDEVCSTGSRGSSNNINCLWELQVGEIISAITLGRPSTVPAEENEDILVCTGETSLFYVSLEGELLLHKRFDFMPMSLCTYQVRPSQSTARQTHILIGTQTRHWMVYNGTKLLWSAKAETVPVAMEVIKVDQLEGAILALDERGYLSLSYLGTQPNMELPLLEKAVGNDFDQIQAEYKTLKKELRKEQARREINTEPEEVCMHVLYPDTEDRQISFGLRHDVPVAAKSMELQIEIICTGTEPITDCDLLVVPPMCMSVDEDCWTIPAIDCGEDHRVLIPLTFTQLEKADGHPFRLILAYKNSKGGACVAQLDAHLPLMRFYKLISPIKEDDPPIRPYLDVIEDHFQARQRISKLDEQIGNAAELYRAVQKRLLTKYKDTRSQNVEHLSALMEKTFHRAMDLGDQMEAEFDRFHQMSGNLKLTSELYVQLLRLRADLSGEDMRLLESLLVSDSVYETEMGWEEVAQCSLKHALHQCFGVFQHQARQTEQEMLNTNALQENMLQFLQRILHYKSFHANENAQTK